MIRAGMRALAGIVLVPCLAVAAPPLADRHPVGTGVAAILAQTETLRPAVLELALAAYARADEQGYVQRPRLTVIDYELPSYEKRLWVIDMTNGRVLHEEWVAHGMGSPTGSGGDMENALSFSNQYGTRKSSLGLLRTAECGEQPALARARIRARFRGDVACRSWLSGFNPGSAI